ncbi:hypothetical protein ACQ4PT_020324 [Festuca glaucescens]
MWRYSDEADPMQLQDGILDEVVVNEMTRTLFADADVPDLLDEVDPLYCTSMREKILAGMPKVDKGPRKKKKKAHGARGPPSPTRAAVSTEVPPAKETGGVGRMEDATASPPPRTPSPAARTEEDRQGGAPEAPPHALPSPSAEEEPTSEKPEAQGKLAEEGRAAEATLAEERHAAEATLAEERCAAKATLAEERRVVEERRVTEQRCVAEEKVAEEVRTAAGKERAAEASPSSAGTARSIPQRPVVTEAPSGGLGEGDRTTWTLEVTRGPSDRVRIFSAAVQAVHAGLDMFGAELAQEEARLAAERTLITEAWRRFHQAMEAGRQADEAARLRREEARREAKEICTGSRRPREGHHHREGALATHEEAVAAQNVEVGSLRLELSHREEEATRRKSDLSIRENELILERLRLETLEGQLEEGRKKLEDSQASYDDRLATANARLAEKEKGLQETIAQKFQAELEKVRVEHHGKQKLQEARFTEKKKALEDAKKKLEVELQGVRASLDKVTRAKDAATGEASRLTDELASLQAQVGPVTEAVKKCRQEALAAMTLRRERCKMFRTLVARANSAVGRLGARDFPATNLNIVAEEDCRELLSLAGTCIFANLLHADPSFDFATVLRHVEPAHAFKLSQGVKEHVEALLELYQRKKDGDSAEASSKTSGDALDEDVDDSGSSE